MKTNHWNLKMNKINLSILIVLFFINSVYAQKKIKWSLSFDIGASYTGSQIQSDVSAIMPAYTNTYTHFADSINSKYITRRTYACNFLVNYNFNKNTNFHVGIGYLELGFNAPLRNLKYADMIYPGVGTGQVFDLTNSTRNIDLNYRFQYLSMPIQISRNIYTSKDFNWDVDVYTGMNLLLLMKHSMQANLLDNYQIDGQSAFNIDSTGYHARIWNINVMAGCRVLYKYNSNYRFYVAPQFTYSPLSLTDNEIHVKSYQAGILIGVQHVFTHK